MFASSSYQKQITEVYKHKQNILYKNFSQSTFILAPVSICVADFHGPGVQERILENFKTKVVYCEPRYKCYD